MVSTFDKQQQGEIQQDKQQETQQQTKSINLKFAPIEPTFDKALFNKAPILKITFKEQVRKFQFEGLSFETLVGNCLFLFGLKNARGIQLKYYDEKGELITFSTNAELSLLLETFKVAEIHILMEVNEIPKALILSNGNKLKGNQNNDLIEGQVVHLILPKRFGGSALGIDQKGQLSANCPLDDSSKWIINKVSNKNKAIKEDNNNLELLDDKGEKICLAWFKDPSRHLRILPNGKIDTFGKTGKWAQFYATVFETFNPNKPKRIFLCSVGNEGKKNNRNKNDWYLGVGKNTQLLGTACRKQSRFRIIKA